MEAENAMHRDRHLLLSVCDTQVAFKPFTAAAKIAGVASLVIALVIGIAWSGEQMPDPPADTPFKMQLPKELRAYFRNPDGSCVQCSIGMIGIHCNQIQATTLLWDTEYGKAQRGGSGPARVAAYCNSRGIRAWNITGQPTFDWMKWAGKTGRFAAIGFNPVHFQTLYGYDPKEDRWYVCDNNSTYQVTSYSNEEFQRRHLQSGRWCVILKEPMPEDPEVVEWWR